MQVLVLNAGSSSLKFALYAEGLTEIARGRVANLGPHARFELSRDTTRTRQNVVAITHEDAVRLVLSHVAADWSNDGVVVHRIVHGGMEFSSPVWLDEEVLTKLAELEILAPLHVPASRQAIAVTREVLGPAVPSVAVFDTALFQSLPPAAREYALPTEWRTGFGVRRYGFHGFAHQCLRDAALRTRAATGPLARIVTVQLGRGCSVAAFRGASPIATSMGFSPLEGLIMPTRSGSVDAAAALYLIMRGRLKPEEVLRDLNEKSGLLGLSGISAEPVELLRRARDGDSTCALALDAFFYQLHQYLGAYAGLLGGLDVVAMGGGLCEHVPEVRERLMQGVAWLGCEFTRPVEAHDDVSVTVLSRPSSKVLALLVFVDEERIMAEQVVTYLRTREVSSPA